jgi:hypothetical protein
MVYSLKNKIFTYKVKHKFVNVLALRAFRGSRGLTPSLINLSTRWRWVVNIMPQFACGKEPQYPFSRRLSGPQIWSGYCTEERECKHADDVCDNAIIIVALPTQIHFAPYTEKCWIVFIRGQTFYNVIVVWPAKKAQKSHSFISGWGVKAMVIHGFSNRQSSSL